MYEKRLNIPVTEKMHTWLIKNVPHQGMCDFVRDAIQSKMDELSTVAHLHKKRKKSIVK